MYWRSVEVRTSITRSKVTLKMGILHRKWFLPKLCHLHICVSYAICVFYTIRVINANVYLTQYVCSTQFEECTDFSKLPPSGYFTQKSVRANKCIYHFLCSSRTTFLSFKVTLKMRNFPFWCISTAPLVRNLNFATPFF